MVGHFRSHNKIRCRICRKWAHVATSCWFKQAPTNSVLNTLGREFLTRNQQASYLPNNSGRQRLSINLVPLSYGGKIYANIITVRKGNFGVASLASPSLLASSVVAPALIIVVIVAPLSIAEVRCPSSKMAALFFDPAPFLSPGHQAIQVDGRPSHVRAICPHLHVVNADLNIITLFLCPKVRFAFTMSERFSLSFCNGRD